MRMGGEWERRVNRWFSIGSEDRVFRRPNSRGLKMKCMVKSSVSLNPPHHPFQKLKRNQRHNLGSLCSALRMLMCENLEQPGFFPQAFKRDTPMRNIFVHGVAVFVP